MKGGILVRNHFLEQGDTAILYFLNRGRHQEDKFRFHDKINSNIATMTYHLYGQDMDLTHHISCNYQQAAAYLEWWMSMELWLHSAPQIQWLPTTIHHFQGFFNISTWWYMSLVCRNGALAMYLCIHSIHISRGTSSSAACLFQCRFVILVGWKKLQSRWLFGIPYWDDHCVTKLIINPRCFEYLCLNFRQIYLHPSHKWIPRP